MSLSSFESTQPRTTFFRAGQTAYLIGVPLESNPYTKHTPESRSAWDQGYKETKKRYQVPYAAEAKLALFLGYQPPKREYQREFTRGFAPQRRQNNYPRPNPQQKYTRYQRKDQTQQGAFRVER